MTSGINPLTVVILSFQMSRGRSLTKFAAFKMPGHRRHKTLMDMASPMAAPAW